MSTRRLFPSRRGRVAAMAATFTAVVVFPTPPFAFSTANEIVILLAPPHLLLYIPGPWQHGDRPRLPRHAENLQVRWRSCARLCLSSFQEACHPVTTHR